MTQWTKDLYDQYVRDEDRYLHESFIEARRVKQSGLTNYINRVNKLFSEMGIGQLKMGSYLQWSVVQENENIDSVHEDRAFETPTEAVAYAKILFDHTN